MFSGFLNCRLPNWNFVYVNLLPTLTKCLKVLIPNSSFALMCRISCSFSKQEKLARSQWVWACTTVETCQKNLRRCNTIYSNKNTLVLGVFFLFHLVPITKNKKFKRLEYCDLRVIAKTCIGIAEESSILEKEHNNNKRKASRALNEIKSFQGNLDYYLSNIGSGAVMIFMTQSLYVGLRKCTFCFRPFN